MSTVQKLLSLEPPNIYSAVFGPARDLIAQAPPAVDPELLFGVELEIERVPNWDRYEFHGMSSTADGSLRNNGREFLLQPTKFPDAFATLSHFFNLGGFTEQNYSDRTSIHVHTNCQDLKIDELQAILFLYQATESLLFNWVNPERADNIFCVPWSQTNLSFQIFDGKRDIRKFRNWAKYTALNLLPLYSYGTIEWRHMHGHSDVAKIVQWLQIISCFYRYARKVKIDELKDTLVNLNTTSHYGMFVDMVFQEHANFIYQQPNWQQQLEENILMLKYAISDEVKTVKGKKADTGIMDDVVLEEALEDLEPRNDRVDAQNAANPRVEFWPAPRPVHRRAAQPQNNFVARAQDPARIHMEQALRRIELERIAAQERLAAGLGNIQPQRNEDN